MGEEEEKKPRAQRETNSRSPLSITSSSLFFPFSIHTIFNFSMILLQPLVLLGFIFAIDGKRQKYRGSSSEEDSSVEESDSEWESIACSAYEICLREYDDRISDCGHNKEKEPDEEDSCYEPIKKYFNSLISKKEKKNHLLRSCYNNANFGTTNKKKDKAPNQPKVGTIGKRHRSSCRQKFGELMQYLNGKRKKSSNSKHPAAQPMGAESCHAAAKRVKERCQKIESCCPRVKSCRLFISQHSMVEEMRELEAKIREERRMCREREFLK